MAPRRPIALRFGARARSHIIAIQDFLSERNVQAAAKVTERIRTAAEMLRYFPFAGRIGRAPATREWVVQGLPYILVYELIYESGVPAEIIVLGVFHGAQDRDDTESGG